MSQSPDQKTPPFELFRAKDAVDYTMDGPMTPVPMTDVETEGATRLYENGFLEGGMVKLLYSRPGMSLTYCWFKSGYPLPHHSHSADCLYFIVSGTLKLGNEVLGAGDGFFLGTDVPYSYVPGEGGVEVLEFRTSDNFDFKMLAKSESYWDKAVVNLLAAKDKWPAEKAAPSGIEAG